MLQEECVLRDLQIHLRYSPPRVLTDLTISNSPLSIINVLDLNTGRLERLYFSAIISQVDNATRRKHYQTVFILSVVITTAFQQRATSFPGPFPFVKDGAKPLETRLRRKKNVQGSQWEIGTNTAGASFLTNENPCNFALLQTSSKLVQLSK